jgi:hypothetical protein
MAFPETPVLVFLKDINLPISSAVFNSFLKNPFIMFIAISALFTLINYAQVSGLSVQDAQAAANVLVSKLNIPGKQCILVILKDI